MESFVKSGESLNFGKDSSNTRNGTPLVSFPSTEDENVAGQQKIA